MNFDTLGLAPELLRALVDAGYTDPTDVQAQAIPAALAGTDLLVSSRTGSGKTAAFVLPALQRVIEARRAGGSSSDPRAGGSSSDPRAGGSSSDPRAGGSSAGPREGASSDPREGGPSSHPREGGSSPAPRQHRAATGPRVLVLTPTRELAMQVAKSCATYGRHVKGLRVATVVGGVPYHAQLKALRGPLDVLVATPGRLLDHLASGKAMLAHVEIFVLDEADRMLDMGFIDDIRAVADTLPAERQTLMFSATFDGPVGSLARALAREPQRIRAITPAEEQGQIEQRLHWADNRAHRDALLDHVLAERDLGQALVFTSTQRDADALADRLAEIGHAVASLHGGMPQGRRNRVLAALRTRQLRVLVATDVAARGIDVPSITHVVNYGLPMKAEDYVHRIGRTGRAGRAGLAITLAERHDAGMIKRIERFTTQAIPAAVVAGLEPKAPPPASARPANGRRPHEQPGRRPAPRSHATPDRTRAGAPSARGSHATSPRRSLNGR